MDKGKTYYCSALKLVKPLLGSEKIPTNLEFTKSSGRLCKPEKLINTFQKIFLAYCRHTLKIATILEIIVF